MQNKREHMKTKTNGEHNTNTNTQSNKRLTKQKTTTHKTQLNIIHTKQNQNKTIIQI